ncbi:NnrU family protein [Ottowia sp.]|uniref:NnrU family protein n=1 Tax=Ottowia sp. TaxID=1898956 RepID=UPI002B943233|nr:NnrU family protein [Ottowia sp.]HOB67250.1 NnrU family protein [Ottowia sp.]HPZ55759.1 NnrU family protein [Ottowia sp.]HQD46376.1 NnrU family protein [Ottowia sp.]
MLVLVIGLLIFLGAHSVRIVAERWRAQTIARIGEKPWKGLYTLVSLIGFALIIWGYGLARQQPLLLWQPPVMMKHLNSLFTLLAFIFLAAAYVPRNQIKARLHHPMVLGVKLWAFGHLLATAKLADVVLFGAFLLWAILDFRAARQRDRALGTVYAPGTLGGTLIAVAIGVVAWGAFAFWLHAAWIGIAPLGRNL